MLTAHARLSEGELNFVGNLEGFDLPHAGAQVVVADGFTGNVALKVLEGTVRALSAEIRSRIRSGIGSSLGGLLIRGKLDGVRDDLDPERVGGAILLGLRKPVVVAHGSFGPVGIEHAVKLARSAVDEDMVGRTATRAGSCGCVAVRARW